MKFASYKNGQRDGQLMLVSRDLKVAADVSAIAPTLQFALDNWYQLADELQDCYEKLNDGKLATVAFQPIRCESPLPRAYQWADGSAYVNHVELVRRARGAEMPDTFWTEPLMYQGGSDDFIGPVDDIILPSDEWGIDFEAEVAVVTDDVPMNCSEQNAAEGIRLIMLVNDVSLRNLIPSELAKGFGFFQSKPASSFSPVAVTPDELGNAWRDCKVHHPLRSTYNGVLFGKPDAGTDMTFNFAQLIVHAAKSRNLRAGTIVGSGTVSNKQRLCDKGVVGKGGVGYSCIAERRMIETLVNGCPSTPFMQFGDNIRIEMLSDTCQSIFGAIEQRVKPLS
ncbi:fumarylacetoacetate hydrolase family protein [Alteromonas sp. C1M14]|uniref:fumarylacetoacetate hydrolase family protein n=1 Tax=Alteromonas sp. C1M14 TaxID=2841567 RepID=UPI001C084C5D|nr:fumarylacetoacetate hydrolase family protein [Alteromonas sp. C1M14]MBU2978021.1 fumarylacetoacetate hydrolase family protein [Alteromonas sp. C1M14]